MPDINDDEKVVMSELLHTKSVSPTIREQYKMIALKAILSNENIKTEFDTTSAVKIASFINALAQHLSLDDNPIK